MATDISAAIESAYQLLGFIFDAGDLIEVRTLGARRSQHYAVLPGVAKILETVATYPEIGRAHV